MMQRVRIFRPCVSVSQSASGNSHKWVLEFEPTQPVTFDPLMGWSGSGDMNRQVRLNFDTKKQALAYAAKMGYEAVVSVPETRSYRPMAYADNFAYRKA